jgi:hypothetical protein
MKKLMPTIAAILCLLFISSCKKGDDKLILGTWELKTVAEHVYIDGVDMGGETYPFEPGEASLEFRKDNTYTSRQAGEPDQSGTYALAGDQLTIDGGTARIELTKTTMKISNTTEEVYNGQTYKTDGEAYLEKL